MKKHIFILAMLLLPLLSSAEEVRIGGLWYNLISKGKVAEVIQDNGDGIYYGDIVIPDKVTYEDVEYSVTSIGGSAFYNCSGLTSVIIGDNVTSIGDNAFYCCESLTSLSIPSGLTSIGRYTFYQCNALTSVHITDLTAWCNINFSHQYSNPLSCAHHLFINGEEIKDLVIPNSVTTIKKVAFFGFSGMTSISISNSVTSIGDAAFHSCSGLASVTIPNSVTSIEASAFMECSSLTEVSIGDNVTTIGDYVFQNCKALTTVTIGNSVTNVGNYMFNGCTALSSINIPNSVTSIGSYAFAGCSQLSTAIIGNGVMTIGPYAFQNCTNLSSISIGTNVKNINNFAFYGCTALSSIEIPNSVTTIGNNTFNGCSSLTSVIIGTSINSIGLAAFANCTELSDVFCYNEVVPTAQTSAFNGSYIEYATLHVIASAYENYRTTEPWSGFGTIVIIDGETPVVEKCATPTITYANGKVRFACETEGVEYVPTVTVTPNQLLNGNELALGGAFTVSVYAVKEGYDNSDTATMTINMAQMGDVNADGQVTIADVTSLVNAILGK